jgi:PAS domain S-box-containing protein
MVPNRANAPSVSLEMCLGSAVAMIGLVGLLGWSLDLDGLRAGLPRGITMKANTALCFFACGIAVCASSGAPGASRRQVVGGLAAAVALLGGLSILEEFSSIDLDIDQFMFKDVPAAGSMVRPGRMSPATAFCFLAIAVSLVLSVSAQRMRLQRPLAAALSASAVVIGAMFLAAFLSNRAFGFRWGATTTMACLTSLSFVLLGAANLSRIRRLQRSVWTLGAASTTGFVVGMLTMLGAAELTTSFAKDMEESTSRVVTTQQILHVLQEIRTDMRSLESAQRGYLLQGDESFVARRELEKTAVHQLLAELASWPSGVALPAAKLQALQHAVDARLVFGDKLVDLQRHAGFEAARALFNTGQDVALTQAIVDAIGPLVKSEQGALAERQRHLQAVTATTFLLLPIGSFLGLTALLAGLFFLDDGHGRRLRAEQAIARGRAQLQVVFDNMAEGIRVIDETGSIVQMNPSGATVHGLIDSAPTLQAIFDQLAATANGKLLAEDEVPAIRALRGEFVRNLPLRFERKDGGGFIIAEITTAPQPTAPGEPRQVVVTSHDVTERIAAESATRAARERLERVVENLPTGVLIHGLTDEEIHWNRAALEMYELPRQRVVGMSNLDFSTIFELSTLDGRVLELAEWPMSRVMAGEVLQRVELRSRRLDIDWERVFAYEGAAIQGVAGSPLVLMTVIDVSARNRAESALKQLNGELEHRVAQRTKELDSKTRELETFCYSVSHDLKAPLRGIDGYSRLLAEEYEDKLDDDGRMFIGNVRTAAAQMNTLIEDLLAYSQQERRAMAPARIALRAFVARKVGRRASDLARVTLHLDVQDVFVRADPDGLAMALRNLIDNAVKFSARATPPIITIRSEVKADKCLISVQDNGTGFDMRYYDKIFEIFQRLHRAEDYPGTGVGLALVRKAMERMGGRVWAQSTPGEGATFYLELDLALDTAEADA